MNEKLENSIPLNNLYFKSEISNNEIIALLWAIIYPKKVYKGESKQANHLRFVLAKLYDCDKSKYDFIGYSRNSNDYISTGVYNTANLSYRVLVKIIDDMIDHGFIHQHTGYYDNTIKSGKSSRMKATDKLIELIESFPDSISKTEIKIDYGNIKSFIVLKDPTKKSIKFEDTDLTIEWNNVLRAYNDLISRSKITLNTETSEVINFDNIIVRRIFNDSSFGLGGRFYGGWWQNAKSELRKQILIDGIETNEIDYKSFHLILAYSMIGIDYFNEIGDDPYIMDEIESAELYRDLFKTICFRCLNCNSKSEAIKSLNQSIFDGEIKKHPKYKLSQLVDICVNKHFRLSNLLYSGIGKLLQNNDSMIAHNIINHFTNKNILILSIHDSFVCQNTFKDELYSIMVDSINNTYGCKISLKVI